MDYHQVLSLLCPLLLVGFLGTAQGLGSRDERGKTPGRELAALPPTGSGTGDLTHLLMQLLSEVRSHHHGCSCLGPGPLQKDRRGSRQQRGGAPARPRSARRRLGEPGCNALHHIGGESQPNFQDHRRSARGQRAQRWNHRPRKVPGGLPEGLTNSPLTNLSPMKQTNCSLHCEPSTGKIKMDLKEFCSKGYVIRVRVFGSRQLGDWRRFRVSISSIYRPPSWPLVPGVRHLWVPSRDLSCGCLGLGPSRTYLVLGGPGTRLGPPLVVDRTGDSLLWRGAWGSRLRKLQGAQKEGRCREWVPSPGAVSLDLGVSTGPGISSGLGVSPGPGISPTSREVLPSSGVPLSPGGVFPSSKSLLSLGVLPNSGVSPSRRGVSRSSM
ncbi:uncharacterized protein [Narcine bancroftii]|uniref:uncharacterized protein n=1 Tax=Narcine bancroftii TaxID=1343680 RepID=UPI003831B44A